MNFTETAKKYLCCDLSVLPVKKDKRPEIPQWTDLQRMPASIETAEEWGKLKPFGIGIICGAISGNVVCIDIDEKHDPKKSVSKELSALLKEWGRDDLLARCVTEKTPSGGFHVVFRAPSSHPCEKIARAENQKEAMIEIKGEGGYFVCDPTPGWELVRGSFSAIPTFDEEETAVMYAAIRALDRNPAPNADPIERIRHEGKSPFDDYHDRITGEEMVSMLCEKGWRQIGVRGNNVHLCRPDKQGRFTSATVHMGLRVFYSFTSSTEFNPGKGYSAAALYAILYHGGDFKKAAKDLFDKGFGEKREQKKPEQKPEKVSSSVIMDGLQKRILDYYDNGDPKGLGGPWAAMNKLMTIRKGLLHVVTGIPSHGKSGVVDQIMVHMADVHGWKIDLFSPEHYPQEVHARRLIQMKSRRGFFGPGRMDKEAVKTAAWEFGESFRFIDSPDDVSFDFILKEWETRKADALVIDPWNELEHTRPRDITESEYIGICLRKLRKFAREKLVSVWIIAHPTKIQRQEKSDERRVPDLYDINGSANWYNKADNGIVVWRNFAEGFTRVIVQKIKFHWDGKLGEFDLKFNQGYGGYEELNPSEAFLGTQNQLPLRDR